MAADADPSLGPLDLVTVVYGAEILLLQLQARSIARLLDRAGIGAILVVVNDRDEAGCVERVRGILPDYGALADRVQILRPDELFALRPTRFLPRRPWARARAAFTANRWRYPYGVKGGWRGNRGWAVQQALKLAVARHGSDDHVLILDAKNHFIRPVSRATFVAPDGRARARLEAPGRKHLRWNEISYRFLGRLPPAPGDISLPTLTLFVVGRSDLLASLEAVEARVGPAETFFARKRSQESEFALINATLANRPGGLEAAFAPGLKSAANIRPEKDAASVNRILARAETGGADILSVHKRRLGRIAPDHLVRLRAIWSAAGLDTEAVISADVARRRGKRKRKRRAQPA